MKSFRKANKNKKNKISEELIAKIAQLLRVGSYAETACAMCDISRQTMHNWMKKGNKQPNSIYGHFVDTVERSLAEAETRDLLVIDSCANGKKFEYERRADGSLVFDSNGDPIVITYGLRPNWQAAGWRLERRHPKKWGRIERVEINAPIEVEKQETEDQRLKRLSDLAKKLNLVADE